MKFPVLTIRDAQKILDSPIGDISMSLDLGKTLSTIKKTQDQVFIQDQALPLSALKKLRDKLCYALINNELVPITTFSQDTNFYYKLVPTKDWPTITISATPMHRHTHMTPKMSAKSMVEQIAPVKGFVLDTCCGLGYTAILASHNAKQVFTFEIDPNVQEITQFNPYSEELYTQKNILLTLNDIAQAIVEYPDNYFDRILHDPPTFRYADQLFSQEFHNQLFRVLNKGGTLYHYTPMPGKLKGKALYPRIIKQLERAGFSDVRFVESASGIRAIKQ